MNETLTPSGAVRQAGVTVDQYLMYAISDIDRRFNEDGYAKKHPELVAAYIKACVMDFNTWATTEWREDERPNRDINIAQGNGISF